MLMVTEEAANVIKEITSDPEVGTLRISGGTPLRDSEETGLQIQLADEPAPDDAVIEGEGAQIYLAQEVVPALDDKVLDAQVEEGGIRFAIMEAPEEAPPV